MKIQDNFSLPRLGAYVRLHYGSLVWQSVIYVTVSLLFGLMFIGNADNGFNIFLFPMINIVMILMVGMGPLVLSSSRARLMLAMVPAAGSEKCTFAVVHVFVVVPLLVIFPFAACYLCGYDYVLTARNDMSFFLAMIDAYVSSSVWTHLLYMILMAAVCLAAVTSLRRHRVVLSVLAVFVTGLLLWISSLVRTVSVMKRMYDSGTLSSSSTWTVVDNRELFEGLTRWFENSGGMTSSVYAVCEAVVIAFLILVCVMFSLRKIKNYQL